MEEMLGRRRNTGSRSEKNLEIWNEICSDNIDERRSRPNPMGRVARGGELEMFLRRIQMEVEEMEKMAGGTSDMDRNVGRTGALETG
jgi:hypothetical protein